MRQYSHLKWSCQCFVSVFLSVPNELLGRRAVACMAFDDLEYYTLCLHTKCCYVPANSVVTLKVFDRLFRADSPVGHGKAWRSFLSASLHVSKPAQSGTFTPAATPSRPGWVRRGTAAPTARAAGSSGSNGVNWRNHPADVEESALVIRGKKKNLTRSLWIDYFAGERLGLNDRIVADCLQDLRAALPGCRQLLDVCFLSDGQKCLYRDLLTRRCQSLGL